MPTDMGGVEITCYLPFFPSRFQNSRRSSPMSRVGDVSASDTASDARMLATNVGNVTSSGSGDPPEA